MDPLGLRPLRVGEILDVAIKIYRARFGTLLRAVSVVVAPVYAFGVIVQLSIPDDGDEFVVESTRPGAEATIDGGNLAAAIAGLLLVTIVTFVASQIATGACFKAVSGAYLGDEPDWRASVRFAFSRVRSLLWVTFLSLFFMFLGIVACIVPGVYLYAAFTVAPAALLFEGVRGTKALTRSRELVRGRWWPTAAVLLLLAILNSLVGGMFGGIGAGLVGGGAGNSFGSALVGGITQLVGSVLTTPLAAAVITVLYFDLRVRKEGFDLELLAQRVGVAPPSTPSGLIPPPPPPPSPTRPNLDKPEDQPPFWPPPPGWRPPSSP